MSTYAAPDAVGGMPGLGGPGMPDPSGMPPPPGSGGDMASLAALLQGGGGGMPPGGGGGLPPELMGGGGGDPLGALTPEDVMGGMPDAAPKGTDLLNSMGSTDHIRAAIKHLMMAMTESSDDEESHGITKGMTALHAILAGKAKNQKAITAAGG